MRFRKLRIAWSVGCAIACVLLIALWVRSYWCWDACTTRQVAGQNAEVGSRQGWLGININMSSNGSFVQHREYSFSTMAVIGESNADWELKAYNFPQGWAYSITTRHWLPAFAAAIFAIVPWMTWRFSLRTLLIATTLVAVVLCLIVYATR